MKSLRAIRITLNKHQDKDKGQILRNLVEETKGQKSLKLEWQTMPGDQSRPKVGNKAGMSDRSRISPIIQKEILTSLELRELEI